MNIKHATIEDLKMIDSYIEETDHSTLYHKYLWGIVIEKSFGHKYYYLMCEDADGRVCGVLPLVHMKSLVFGNMLASMPFFNYGGVCSENPLFRELLINEAVRIAKDLKASHIEFRQEGRLNNDLPLKSHKVSMRLELPGSADELWKSFPSKLRSQIRRSEKEGMTVRIGRHEELDGFYENFSICMKKLGTPVYPKHFFRNILDIFPDSTWISSVYLKNIPVASGFLASFKNRLEIPWASSNPRYNRFSPNMLLYWSCLKDACEKGFGVFDFGRSTVGEGTYKFKEQWGAVPFQMNWHYWIKNNGVIPDLTNRNPKYRLAIAVWKNLPLPVTKILGPEIVKYIP